MKRRDISPHFQNYKFKVKLAFIVAPIKQAVKQEAAKVQTKIGLKLVSLILLK